MDGATRHSGSAPRPDRPGAAPGAPSATVPPPAGGGELPALTATLWEGRVHTELLLYRLAVARLFLLADQRAHAARALDEAAEAVSALAGTEPSRLDALHAFAEAHSVAPERLTLRRVATSAPPPWRIVFTDHLDRLRHLVDEIGQVARHDLDLAERGLGAIMRDAGGASLLDRQEAELRAAGYRAGIAALHAPLPSTLVRFVLGHDLSAPRSES